MNPQEPQQQNYEQPIQPQSTPPAFQMPPQAPNLQIIDTPRKSHKKLALLLLIGPTALLIGAIILYTISHFIFNSAEPVNDEMFADPSPIQTLLNILFFVCGAVSIITWLPGLIIGIVLLARKSR